MGFRWWAPRAHLQAAGHAVSKGNKSSPLQQAASSKQQAASSKQHASQPQLHNCLSIAPLSAQFPINMNFSTTRLLTSHCALHDYLEVHNCEQLDGQVGYNCTITCTVHNLSCHRLNFISLRREFFCHNASRPFCGGDIFVPFHTGPTLLEGGHPHQGGPKYLNSQFPISHDMLLHRFWKMSLKVLLLSGAGGKVTNMISNFLVYRLVI